VAIREATTDARLIAAPRRHQASEFINVDYEYLKRLSHCSPVPSALKIIQGIAFDSLTLA
jgi:hypothetical protein